MVRRIYICSNLKFSDIVQQCDHVEDCNSNNFIMSRSSSFVLKIQVTFQEGEKPIMLLMTTSSTPTVKPRTVFFQEGEDDEDIPPIATHEDNRQVQAVRTLNQ